jgi:hypothetical protein
MAKRVILDVVKVIAGIAGLVFLFMPLSTPAEVLLCVGSLSILLICVVVSHNLDDEHTGYWPRKPTKSRQS